ncbi:DUF2867 domain-containing protein [Burkholderia aenigmatica]|uniref:DUF2867 domain-containing protein n=1 Tax=Burkholderia cepacia complex TaxID=87882 RepID=UPI000F090991|nr:hypothetical protein CVS37_13115 [Burkholderia lata]
MKISSSSGSVLPGHQQIGIQPSSRGSEVTISTLVKINNRIGKGYLSVIMPFHKLLSRVLLQRAVSQSV